MRDHVRKVKRRQKAAFSFSPLQAGLSTIKLKDEVVPSKVQIRLEKEQKLRGELALCPIAAHS